MPGLPRSFLRAGDRILARAAQESDYLAKLRSYLLFLRSERKEPLLVYQMGKVGSSTLVASLQANAPVRSRYAIYHLHRLTQSGLRQVDRLNAESRARLRNSGLPKGRFQEEHLLQGHWLGKRIRDPRNRRKWLVVTLVREPIARNVSSFFQNLETRMFFDYRSRLASSGQEAAVAEVTRLFYENYLDDRAIDRIDANPMTWFDSELKQVFGVDVYASEFPKTRGYRIYEAERARVLLLRLEDLDRVHAEALKEFLQIDQFALVKANTGEAKAYSELYDAFLGDLVLPPEYVDEIYGSRYARHFYSEPEIQEFRARWKKTGRAPELGRSV